jgi:hypothetical protein
VDWTETSAGMSDTPVASFLHCFHPDSACTNSTYITPLCHKLNMANKEIHFRTRSEMSNFNYFTDNSTHTDKATPSNYGVLQNATKSATFKEKSILLLEQWLPNLQFKFFVFLDFEAW